MINWNDQFLFAITLAINSAMCTHDCCQFLRPNQKTNLGLSKRYLFFSGVIEPVMFLYVEASTFSWLVFTGIEKTQKQINSIPALSGDCVDLCGIWKLGVTFWQRLYLQHIPSCKYMEIVTGYCCTSQLSLPFVIIMSVNSEWLKYCVNSTKSVQGIKLLQNLL